LALQPPISQPPGVPQQIGKTLSSDQLRRIAPTIPNWVGLYVGPRIFRYSPESGPGFITLDGSGAGAIVAKVPLGHRLVRIEMQQTDASTPPVQKANFTANFQQLFPNEGQLLSIFALDQTQTGENGLSMVFGDGWERQGNDYKLNITSGQASGQMFVALTIQYLPEIDPVG
jgi:hypothetical protein